MTAPAAATPLPDAPLPATPLPATSGPPGIVLALVDLAAVGALAIFGAYLVATLDRFGALGRVNAIWLSLPFTLVGPLGVGVERGRSGPVSAGLALAVAVGASTAAIAGLVAFEGRSPPAWVLAGRALPSLVLGAPLVLLGTRLSRPDEDWRAAARVSPPEATPALARRIAHGRLPLALRLVLAPLALATLPLAAVLLVLVRCYQITFSRLMPPQCRFEPSCSRYGFEALRRFGLARGLALTLYRIGRCQPFCTGGHDPVPESEAIADTRSASPAAQSSAGTGL